MEYRRLPMIWLFAALPVWPVVAQPTGASLTPAPAEAFRNLQTGAIENYRPATGRLRAQWYLRETAGSAIGGAVLSAAWGTAWGSPREYPATWEHFGKRWALSMSGVVTGNAMEAGLGGIWGEDPRYCRIRGHLKQNFGRKLKNVFLSTVAATNRDGERMPAYARYIGLTGSNFLQMAWRPESQSSAGDALVRIGYGFLGRLGANALDEFLPNVKEALARRKRAKTVGTDAGTP